MRKNDNDEGVISSGRKKSIYSYYMSSGQLISRFYIYTNDVEIKGSAEEKI